MAEFRSRANQGIITVAGDDEDILLCPNCFFPNSGTARECVACNYTLQNGNVRWLRAGFIRPCSNPNCTAFVFSRDTQCPNAGIQSGTPIKLLRQKIPTLPHLLKCREMF